MSINIWLQTATILGLVLTATALVATLIQFNRVRKQSSDLSRIADSMSTRHIGPFPGYLSSITKLLNKAQYSIEIVSGTPCPGYMISRSNWIGYKQVLEKKAHEGVKIKLVCSSKEQRKNRLAKQINIENLSWEKWKNKNEIILREFFEFSGLPIQNTDTHEGLIDSLLEYQDHIIANTFQIRNIDVYEVSEFITIQLWVIDKCEAIFAIQTDLKNVMSSGLYTADVQLIKTLRSMVGMFENEVGLNDETSSYIDT